MKRIPFLVALVSACLVVVCPALVLAKANVSPSEAAAWRSGVIVWLSETYPDCAYTAAQD